MRNSKALLLGSTELPGRARHRRSLMVALLGAAGTLAGAQAAHGQAPTQPATSSPSPQATRGPAARGDSNPSGIGDIIVTAQKRSTSLQKTPLAITALSGQDLGAAQVKTLADVATVAPGLRVGGAQGFTQLTIRGIGSSNVNPGGDSPVAVNVNDVFISRQTGVLTSLYDVDSVEIIKGPQGTLYGRNATAGAINVRTVRPSLTTWGGAIEASVGNYAATYAEAAIGGPVATDKLGIRVAGFVDRHDGYFRNLATGNGTDARNARGARVTLLAAPTDNLTATIIGDYYREKEDAGGLHYFGSDSQIDLPGVYPAPPTILFSPGGYVPSNIRDIAAGYDPKLKLETYSVTGILEWKSGPFSLKSISAYRHQTFQASSSLDGGAAPGNVSNMLLVKGEPDHQFSEELQGHYDTERLHLTVGGYYFSESDLGPDHAILRSDQLFANPSVNVLGAPAPAGPPFYTDLGELSGKIDTKAEAVFGQAEYQLLDGLTLIAGARYSHERKTYLAYNFVNIPITNTQPIPFDPTDPLVGSTVPFPSFAPPQAAAPAKFSAFTPRLGLQYQVDPHVMAYFTYAKGFKAGGFDMGSAAATARFAPENIESFEAGLKSTLFDNRLRLNLSAYHYRYTSLQVQQVIGFSVFTQNAGSAVSNGGEAEITFKPASDWTLFLSANYTDAHYTDFVGASAAQTIRQFLFPGSPNVDFKGKKLNNAPPFTAFASVEKRWELGRGAIFAKAEAEYSDRFYFSADNVAPLDQGKYAKVNLALRYESTNGWTATAFVRNLTDHVTKTSAFVVVPVVGAPIGGSVSAPRTFGINVGYHF